MMFLSVSAAIIYLVSCLLLYKANPVIFSGYLLLIPNHVYNIVSLLLIESGGWIVEQGRFGYENGSTIIYTILLFFILLGYWMAHIAIPKFSITKYIKKNELLDSNNNQLVGIFILLIIFICTFSFAAYNASGVEGLQRHNFLQYTYPKWSLFFLVSMYAAIGWYTILRIKGFGNRVVVFILFSFGSILYGGSFSTIINNVVLLIIAQTLENNEKSSKKKLIVFLLFGFIVASIVKMDQEHLAKGYTEAEIEVGFKFIIDRLTTQAHLIWFSVERYSSNTLIEVGFYEFLMDFFNPTHILTTEYGLGRLMFQVNNEFGQVMVEEGIGMSGGFPSIVLASAGLVPAIITSFCVGAVFFLFYSYLINVVKNYGFPLFFVTFYFFNQFSNIIYNGDFGFINFKTIIYMIIFIVFYKFGSKYLKGRVWPVIRF